MRSESPISPESPSSAVPARAGARAAAVPPGPGGAEELTARWPGLDLRPVRLNGTRGEPVGPGTYTVLDPRSLRVVGEIRGHADGRFTASVPGGTWCRVFDTVAAALAAFQRG